MANRLRNSITLWVQGGLGNQLFQLNAGLTASAASEAPLLISRASYWRDSLRGFQLKPLVDERRLATLFEDLLVGPPHARSGELRKMTKRMNLRISESVAEADSGSVLMVGYFQDQGSIRLGTGKLLERLRAVGLDPKYASLGQMVEQRPVVHIRRGDYVTLASARKTFGTLSSEYYHEALDRLGHQASDAVFFSDDPEFVRREFGVSPELVIGPSAVKSDLQTLMLMSLGQDIVIPNSTFSWWAAELMGKRGQVVAPKIWFYDRDESQWPQRQHWLRHDNK